MVFVVAKKKAENGLLLVITDKEILSKTFSEGKLQLDLTKEFYKGKKMNKKEVLELIKEARHLHLTGKHSVGLGVELDLVETSKILYIENVPHAEVVLGG